MMGALSMSSPTARCIGPLIGKTKVGQKAIQKIPVLMSKGAELGQQAVQEHISELTKAIQKREKELKNKN